MSATASYPVETPRAYVFDDAYATAPNWDIGRPQRAFVRVVEADLIRGPVLDVGCGTGELPLFLARRGHDVLGIDVAPRAVEQARAKARWRRIPAHLLVRDALDLDGLADDGFRVRTAVDSGFFHLLGDRERDRYVEGLARVLGPDGAFFVPGDARRDQTSTDGLTPAERRDRFRPESGWQVAFVAESVFERRGHGQPAYFGGIERREDDG